MIHRHLEYDAQASPEAWPLGAIADILERGDLEDWRPLAAAVARNPSGPLAERIERLVDVYPLYGTSPLWRAFIERRRARTEGEPSSGAARLPLGRLRREHGVTQAELGSRLGISQSDVSKLERRRDLRLSTLAAYSRALGGKLRLLFSSPARKAEIEPPSD